MTSFPPALRLEQAIACGDGTAVAALLDADAGLLDTRFADNLGLTPLMWAARRRQEDVVAELLRRGADPALVNRQEANGDGGNTALWFVAQGPASSAAGIAARLIAAGADPDIRCEHGQTALYIAASWGHLDVVQRLVEGGASPTIPDNDGRTPLERVLADLAWCAAQADLTADQRRFRESAPRVIDFLRSRSAP